MPSLQLLAAFVRRDWLTARSYRFQLGLDLVGGFLGLAVFFYVARLVDAPHGVPGGDYFAFVVVGVIITTVGHNVVGAFPNRIRESQTQGTLEALLATPAPAWVVIVGTGTYDILRAAATAAALGVLAITVFGVPFPTAGAFGFGLVAAGGLVCLFAALGIFLASATLLIRQISGLTTLLTSAIAFLTGAYFPRSTLPAPLEELGGLLPFSWGLDSLRQAWTIDQIALGKLAVVVLAAGTSLGLALLTFGIALRAARRAGTLSQY